MFIGIGRTGKAVLSYWNEKYDLPKKSVKAIAITVHQVRSVEIRVPECSCIHTRSTDMLFKEIKKNL